MTFEPGKPEAIVLLGEIVGILEERERRRARIAVRPDPLLEIRARGLEDAHLGDLVRIDAEVVIRAIHHDPRPPAGSTIRADEGKSTEGEPS